MTIRSTLRRVFLLGVCSLFAGGVCPAQKLSQILPGFFAEGVMLESTNHEAHFEDQGPALDAMGQLNAMLASQFATYPLGSSSGAFTYRVDPETGAYVPTSESFGPIFAERPETLGKGKTNIALTRVSYSYDSLEGLELENGDIVFTLVHEDTNQDGGPLQNEFEGDLVSTQLFLDLTLDTNVFFLNHGLTDRLDLGVAVPFVEAELDATFRSTVLPLSTGGSGTHTFGAGSLVEDVRDGGTASGLGDVVLRGKYNFRKGFAGAFNLRLPTGDEEDLLGSGATQLKLLLVARGPKYDIFYGGLHPHMNVGYTISSGDYDIALAGVAPLVIEAPDEINYAVGFDAALGPRVTLALDVVGRVLLDSQSLTVDEEDFLYTSLSGSIATETRPNLVTQQDDLSILWGTAGLKIHLGNNVLLTASAIVPVLDDRGLEDRFAASVGLDFTF